MTTEMILAILGLVVSLITGIIGHFLGQRSERRKQSLAIKAEMIKPLEQYLKGVEKIVGIFSDTMVSVTVGSSEPINYGFDERKTVSNFLSEMTNEVMGIIASDALHTKGTRNIAESLFLTIKEIDSKIKFEILPLENEVLVKANNNTLDEVFLRFCAEKKLQMDLLLQKSYSLIAQIRNSLY